MALLALSSPRDRWCPVPRKTQGWRRAAEADRQRRPSDAVWQAPRATGYFYLFVPQRFGGLQFDSETYIDATLPIAEADASTGWVACFCAEHNWFIAQMPEPGQAEIWGSALYVIVPSVNSPPELLR